MANDGNATPTISVGISVGAMRAASANLNHGARKNYKPDYII